MNKQIEAFKKAIEAFEANYVTHTTSEMDDLDFDAHQACKEALAEAEKQEPVPKFIWVNPSTKEQYLMTKITDTHPATWQSLSDDEIQALALDNDVISVISQVQQALKEKNHG